MLDLKHGCLGDGEHLPADQSLPVAHQQDLGKQLGHFLTHVADEGGERGEVRLGIAGDRHEQHVVATCPLYGARTDDATAVGEQHNLEQYRRGEGRRAAGVVAEASFQRRQIEFPIHQIAQGVLEAAGQNLLGEIDGDEFRRVIDGLEAGHGVILGKDDALYHGHVVACAGRESFSTASTNERDFPVPSLRRKPWVKEAEMIEFRHLIKPTKGEVHEHYARSKSRWDDSRNRSCQERIRRTWRR